MQQSAVDGELSLVESRIDGKVDAKGNLAYVEWTMAFQHARRTNREARAIVQLPPGAVVLRLNLWIDGEMREAAYAGRDQVRDAYEKVVSRRHDPVLVTTAGLNRVEVRNFPVPVKEPIRIRIGMTVSMQYVGPQRSRIVLPYFVTRNFALLSTDE
ncbi:MAG: hypothetical protein HOI95_17710 [Chromatiales bacterium]|nr:hypothetical protein [Chromatiales bacterium]